MQISRTNSLSVLPLPQDQARGQHSSNQAAQSLISQSDLASQTVRSVAEVKQAERMLNRVRTGNTYAAVTEGPRQQKAASAYRALQQQDERAYVSEVLGIDVYA